MNELNLTAPVTATIRRRVKTEEEEEEIMLAAATTTTSSVAVVESPKRRKVESSYASESESARKNRCSSHSSSPRKPLLEVEKYDSSTADTRLRWLCTGTVLHAPASTTCSEEESSSGFIKQISDPLDDWLKSDTSSHFDTSVVISSPESEVCPELPEREMESSKSTTNPQSRSVRFQSPTAAEIDEFFSAAEKMEAQRFKDKYNLDIVNDMPVKGRFEWSRVKH